MNRRRFARDFGVGASAIFSGRGLNLAAKVATAAPPGRVPRELKADVVIMAAVPEVAPPRSPRPAMAVA